MEYTIGYEALTELYIFVWLDQVISVCVKLVAFLCCPHPRCLPCLSAE